MVVGFNGYYLVGNSALLFRRAFCIFRIIISVMINANELRIGNCVRHPDTAYTHREWGMSDWRFAYDFPEYMENISPIALTEEWLLKFGFEKEKEGSNYYKGCLYWWSGDFYQEFYNEGAESLMISQGVKYVHQLQNLYFALTGIELTIKQPATA